MDQTAVINEFKAAKAILKGHFILSSGLHSDTYLQCARALMDPKRASRLCSSLADKVRATLGDNSFDIVIAPAMGGVIVGYEMARQLNVEGMFCERKDGSFSLRRGFAIEPERNRVLVVEDVVTTGKSSLEAIECIQNAGGNVVGEACLINRNANNNPLGNTPLIALTELTVQSYKEDDLPPELQAIPAEKPGSRFLKA